VCRTWLGAGWREWKGLSSIAVDLDHVLHGGRGELWEMGHQHAALPGQLLYTSQTLLLAWHFFFDISVLSGATLIWCELIINTFYIPQIPLGLDANFLRVYYDPFHLGAGCDVAISHPPCAETSCSTDLVAIPLSLQFVTKYCIWHEPSTYCDGTHCNQGVSVRVWQIVLSAVVQKQMYSSFSV